MRIRLAAALPIVLALALGGSAAAQVACGDCNEDMMVANILDALTAAQLGAGLGTPSLIATCSCDVNSDSMVTILDALVIAQFAAGLMVMPMCPMNPCGNTAPTITITMPTSGTLSGVIVITLDADDMEMDPLDLLFEFSTDAGVTFTPATPGGGGTFPTNPSPMVAVPVVAGTFEWDSAADLVGVAMVDTVDFRATADDTFAQTTSTVTFDVDNTGPCTTVICGSTNPGTVGMGTAALFPPMFDFTPGTGDATPFLVDVSGRPVGSAVTITLTNMSDNCDLYIMDPPGPMCGDPAGGLYRACDTMQLVMTIPEAEDMSDSECTFYGDMIPIVVYHNEPTPSATFDIVVDCVIPPTCTPAAGGTGDCASPFIFPPAGGCQTGTTAGADLFQGASCGFAGDPGTGPEHIYSWTPAGSGMATATVCNPGTTHPDTMMHVRETDCTGMEVACNDDFCGLRSSVTFPYTAGMTYVIVVDGYGGAAGFYELTVTP